MVRTRTHTGAMDITSRYTMVLKAEQMAEQAECTDVRRNIYIYIFYTVSAGDLRKRLTLS